MDRLKLKANLRNWSCYKCIHILGARYGWCQKRNSELPKEHICNEFTKMDDDIILQLNVRVVKGKDGLRYEHEYYLTI